jgi:hypothetical protein
MPWLSSPYPETNWGALPNVTAAPIAGVAAAIQAARQQQYENLQQGMHGLAQAIQQQQLDKVANVLSYKMENPQAEGVPSDLPNLGGVSGYKLRILGQQYDPYRELFAKGYYYDPTQGHYVKAAAPMSEYQQQEVGFSKKRLGMEQQRIDLQRQGKAPKPMSANEVYTGYGVDLATLNDPNQQHPVVFDQGTGSYRYAKPGEKATHTGFGYAPSAEKGKELKLKEGELPSTMRVLPNDVAKMLREQTARQPAPAVASGVPGIQPQPNVTQEEYNNLQPGEMFWYNGRQYPKRGQ